MTSNSDPYTDLGSIGQAGENLFKIEEDGSVSMTRKLPEEGSNRLKGKARLAVLRCPDHMIEVARKTSLGTYYRIGQKTTVRGAGNSWLCLTCSPPHNYEKGEHKGCPHIARVKRWAADYPEQVAA